MATSPADPVRCVADIGEFGLIDEVVALFPVTPQVLIGSGDDAALLATQGPVLVTTDLMVEGRHFRRDWSAALDVGHKVAAANLADIAAMGGTPSGLVVGLALPADLPVQWVRDMAAGVAEELQPVGATVVGGDVTESDQIVVAVTALGHAAGDPVTRHGARPGDVLAVAGRLGWAAAGLAVLGRGFRSPRVVVEAHRRPQPPYAAGPQALAAGATAMIDVSDGLLGDLAHVAERSGVQVNVETALVDVPEPLRAVGAALGIDPLSFCLTGGDDHALAATFPPGLPLPQGWRRIGSVRAGEGVTVDGTAHAGSPGHRHFAR